MRRKDKHPNESKKTKLNETARSRGLVVRDLVMPWESKAEFEQLHQELRAEFSPQGRMQEDTVLDLAILRWRKYQLAKSRRAAALKDPFFIELMESGAKSWSAVRKYFREQDAAGKTVTGQIRNAVSKLTETAVEQAQRLKTKGMDKEELERTEQKMVGIIKVISEHVLPLLDDIEAGPSAAKTFELAYLPDYLDKILNYEAKLDARIDKLLARLVSLKEYQRMYGAPMPLPPKTKSPPIAAELTELSTGR
jgi:hypothetical protein